MQTGIITLLAVRMIKFIHIRSAKFPILPGEEKELVNEGMYGKAVAQYLQAKLRDRGYDVPFFCCEDWGWFVKLKNAPFLFGVNIYCWPERDGLLDFFCTDAAAGPRQWSWRRFRFVDTMPWVTKLHDDMVSIFRGDPEVELVSANLDDFPSGLYRDASFKCPNCKQTVPGRAQRCPACGLLLPAALTPRH
jgi:hypothetical protein